MLNESGTDAARGVSPDRATAARNASMRDGAVGRKHFVLDTNVLLHNAQSIFKFAEHEVVIPLAVIEQLDATSLLYPGDRLTVDDAFNLLIETAP